MPSSRSLRSQSSSAQLGRNAPPPAAGPAAYPIQHPGLGRANSINTSSQSSLSPNVTPTDLTPGSSFVFVGNGHESADSFPSYDSSVGGYAAATAALRKPSQAGVAPPPLTHRVTDPRMLTPSLRQSASFSNGDHRPGGLNAITPTRSETGSTAASSISKRHSDESEASSSFRKSRWSTKKKGLPGLIDSVLGSPRKIEISAPENPIHLTHVGYDNETGEFTVSLGLGVNWIFGCPPVLYAFLHSSVDFVSTRRTGRLTQM